MLTVQSTARGQTQLQLHATDRTKDETDEVRFGLAPSLARKMIGSTEMTYQLMIAHVVLYHYSLDLWLWNYISIIIGNLSQFGR